MKQRSFLFLSLFIFLSCASTEEDKMNLSKHTEVIVPVASAVENKEAKSVYFSFETKEENLNQVLQEIKEEINGKVYLKSNVVTRPQLIKKEEAVEFLFLENKAEVEGGKKQELAGERIHLGLERNAKYGAYLFSIKYHDSKKRNWLFSLELSDSDLKKNMMKTLIRFSFQSL